jgi:hypothetical protein
MSNRRFWVWSITALVLGTIVHLPGTAAGPYGFYGFRQSQTAMLIREFMRGGVDLRSPLPVLGPPFFVPMEFPLFQAVAASVSRITGLPPAQAGSLVSLALFGMSSLLIGLILRRWFRPSTAVIAICLLQLVPFGFSWAGATLIEFLPVASILLAVLTIDRWVETPRLWLIAAGSAALIVAFLVKPTTAVVMSPLLLVPARAAWLSRPRWPRLLGVVLPVGAGLVSAAAWTAYSDRVKATSPFTDFLTSQNLQGWNFGTLNQRLNPQSLQVYGEHLSAIVGSLAILIVAAGIAIALNPKKWAPFSLALCPVFAYAIFTNLFVVHTYYAVAVIVPIVGLIAVAIDSASSRVSNNWSARALVGTSIALVVVLSWTSTEGSKAQNVIRQFQEPKLAAEVRASTPAGSGVIVVGCDWDPQLLYAADRRGLMLRGSDRQPVPEEWLGRELTHVVYCADGLTQQLPAGFRLEMVSDHVDRIVRDE